MEKRIASRSSRTYVALTQVRVLDTAAHRCVGLALGKNLGLGELLLKLHNYANTASLIVASIKKGNKYPTMSTI